MPSVRARVSSNRVSAKRHAYEKHQCREASLSTEVKNLGLGEHEIEAAQRLANLSAY